VASLRTHAAEVMDICDRAVKLTESSPGSWDSRDSRGLARALTGDTSGAIEDFQFFIDHTSDVEVKRQRQKWIDELLAGRAPFTPDLLKSLLR